MRAAPPRYRSQEMLQDLFEEINDYLGDKPSETGQVYPSSATSGKIAVEPVEPARPKNHLAQPLLIESDESDDEAYQRYTTSPEDLKQQCLLTCPITEEKPSVCMCYKCNKKKLDEQHLSPPKKSQSSRRPWTPTNALGFGGIADKFKQTFIRPQQQYENQSGYDAQQKRPSSRGARRRWIPRPKSLPSLSLYLQKQEEPEERRSWNSNKHKNRTSMYGEYADDYDDRKSSAVYEPNTEDDDKKQDFVDSSYQRYDYQDQPSSLKPQYLRSDYQDPPVSSQSQYRDDYQEPQYRNDYQEPQYRNDYQESQSRGDYQEPLSSQEQSRINYQEQLSATSQTRYSNTQEPQVAPSQPELAPTTPLPVLTDLPYLTPSTRIGEPHYPLSMKESRVLPTKEERMTAYNNAYYHCIMAKSDLIPWLTKQYSKGPPDAMFEYTPKPKKAPKKLLGIFKLCGSNNNPTKSQSPWQPSVSPSYLISSSASSGESTSLTSSMQQQWVPAESSISLQPPQQWAAAESSISAQEPWVPAKSSVSPASNNTTDSTLSTVTSEKVNYPKEDSESFETVLPRPRSISISPQPRRSRSRTSMKDELQPVSILKKTRSSVSLQPYIDEEDRPRYLAAPSKRRGHMKRLSFSQVEEPIYYRPEYDDDDDDYDGEYFEEDDYRPPRIGFRPRAHPPIFAGSRLNHLRSSRSPVWVDDGEEEPRPLRHRRTRRPSFGRPSSRSSLAVYEDMVPVPRASPVYYY